MATSIKDGLNYIIQAIENIIEPKLEKLRYDKTYRAKVIKKTSDGVYKVQINGTEYSVKYKGDLNVGDIVKVKAPLNNFSDIYIETLPSDKVITSYNDLNNKPAINSTYTVAQTTSANETIQGTISFHKISKTGNYNDLNNKPTIPSVVDNLTSTSVSNALSANQGRLLNNKFGNYLPLTGGTLTGNVHMQKSSSNEDTGYYAKRTDTGTEVWLGVGSGGVNHGVYSTKLGKWIVYADKNNAYLNGTANKALESNKLENINGRITNANVAHTYENSRAHLQLLQATGSMTANKPISDGYILHFSWDNAGSYNAQFFIGNSVGMGGTLQARGCNGANGTWGSWETILRNKTLYDNSSGTTGTITLSESAANFNYLEIFYLRENNDYASTRINSPNNKLTFLQDTYITSQGSLMQIAVKRIKISGTSITSVYDYYANLETNKVSIGTHNVMKITKVVGYR